MWLPALATLATFLANIGINIGLISWKGFLGASIAQSVSRIILFLILAGSTSWTSQSQLPCSCCILITCSLVVKAFCHLMTGGSLETSQTMVPSSRSPPGTHSLCAPDA